MGRCLICGKKSPIISRVLSICPLCLRNRPEEALLLARKAHMESRRIMGLPEKPPSSKKGVPCNICINECVIGHGERGYCGVWENREGKLVPIAGPGKILAYTYLDPHPTNCVAAPVCPGASSEGYPKYTLSIGPEYGYYNLAVFLGGCPLNCLFCQNWEHKTIVASSSNNFAFARTYTIDELVKEALNPKITCVCYFGGDPTPQTPLLLQVSREMIKHRRRCCPQVPFRICWETNGLVNPLLMKAMARISLETGGIVKIDWKAWTPAIYEALTGAHGEKAVKRLKENTKIVAELAAKRKNPPLLVVSILLVPGYVGEYEVRMIARYIASLMRDYNIDIPLVLLGFHPDYLMKDVPHTSRNHAYKAWKAAVEEGIKRVFIGNEWLLTNMDYNELSYEEA